MQTHPQEPTPTVATDRTEATTYDPYAGRRAQSLKITRSIYLLFGLIEALLLIRFVLKALGANPSAGFAQFIYGITAPLVLPFYGMFGNPSAQGSVLELHSIVALIVYGLCAWLLGRLVWILVGETRSAVHTHSTEIEHHV